MAGAWRGEQRQSKARVGVSLAAGSAIDKRRLDDVGGSVYKPNHHSSLSTVYGSNLNYPYHYEGGGARSMPVSPLSSNSRDRLIQLDVILEVV